MGSVFDKNTNILDKQFRSQVDTLWPREAQCLENHGLREAKTVLDIGTGNGYFLCRLAERYPDKKFVGIEASAPLIKKAQEIISASGLSNISVIEGHCPLSDIKDGFDLILSRLAIYCMPNREEVLKWAHGLLRKNGKVALIDVDNGWCYAHPHEDVWPNLFAAIGKKFGTDGKDRFVGRKFPYLLLKAGFKNIQCDLKSWYSSIDLSPDVFVDYWVGDAKTVHAFAPEYFTEKDLEKFVAFVKKVAGSKDQTAMCFICVASGTK